MNIYDTIQAVYGLKSRDDAKRFAYVYLYGGDCEAFLKTLERTERPVDDNNPASEEAYLVIGPIEAGAIKRTVKNSVEAAKLHAAKLLGGKYASEGDKLLIVKVVGVVERAPPQVELRDFTKDDING